MKFIVMTLFPEMIESTFGVSITGRASEKGLISLETRNIRDFARNRYGAVDDYPFGGGAGMVMQAEPIIDCYENLKKDLKTNAPVIYLSPSGSPLTQKKVRELAQYEEIVFLCGHYEGIDQRVIDEIVTEEISIGDYVLTGGELPCLVMMDAISRMVPGVLGNESSSEDESFSGMFLEYPQYSRPRVYRDREVPEVLLSGNHALIRQWRLEESIRKTIKVRPDLIHEEHMDKEAVKAYQKIVREEENNSLQTT